MRFFGGFTEFVGASIKKLKRKELVGHSVYTLEHPGIVVIMPLDQQVATYDQRTTIYMS
jgi:hypothetical protein